MVIGLSVNPASASQSQFPSLASPGCLSKTLAVVDEFRTYVKPRLNPSLTVFCTNLTGVLEVGFGQNGMVLSGHCLATSDCLHFRQTQNNSFPIFPHGRPKPGPNTAPSPFFPSKWILKKAHKRPKHCREWFHLITPPSECPEVFKIITSRGIS